MLLNFLIFFIAILLIGGLLWLWVSTMTEGEKWDLAANSMYVEGWSEAEIQAQLGPRPKD